MRQNAWKFDATRGSPTRWVIGAAEYAYIEVAYHRYVRGRTRRSRHITFLARWPSRQAMQHARDRIRELTARERLLLPVEDIVQDVNSFLRGWAGYFRYGNSARPFDKIQAYALARLALFVAKRHRQPSSYGWLMVAYESPNRMGLINLNGRVVAPRPNRPWREKPNADGEGTSVSRARENLTHGSMGGGRRPTPVG